MGRPEVGEVRGSMDDSAVEATSPEVAVETKTARSEGKFE